MKKITNYDVYHAVSFLLLLLILGSCSKNEPDLIDPESLKIINTKPLLEMTNEGGGSIVHPSEAVAIEFLGILKKHNIQQNIEGCAAMEGFIAAGDSSEKCDNGGYEPSTECLIEEGFGKGRLNTQFETKSFDLNRDNIPDYILTGVSCTGLAGNAANEYFIFLSRKDNSYDLALSVSAGFVSVVQKVNSNEYLILEGISANYGKSVSIWSLKGNKFFETACFFNDHFEKEPAFRKCRKR